MLNCVYHPIDEMRVVDDAEKERLLASGVWFDHPMKAQEYREKLEREIKDEPKVSLPKAKLKGKNHEKLSDVK